MAEIMEVGVQAYTVRDMYETEKGISPEKFQATLEKLGQHYDVVELAGVPKGVDAHTVDGWLKSAGLRAPAAHVSIDLLDGDLAAAATFYKALGAEFIVVPWVGREDLATAEQVSGFAARLNKWAEPLGAYGLKLAYHNHEHEFQVKVKDGADKYAALQVMINNTGQGVLFELDTFWAMYGGQDPAAFVQDDANQGVFPILHIKDGYKATPRQYDPATQQLFTEVGTGDMKPLLPGIIQAARADPDVKYLIVEQDADHMKRKDVPEEKRGSSLESVIESLANLNAHLKAA